MLVLSSIELLDVIKIKFLFLDAAHLFPLAKSFVHTLLVNSIAASGQELLCHSLLLDE